MVGSHCPYCALQCAMQLVADPADPSRLVVAARDFPSNRGGLCRKGWTAAEPLQSADRLTTPLIRDEKGGPLRAASWPEALARITDGIAAAQAKGGADAVALFGGGGLTNEKAYMLGKFARVGLQTRHIDYNGRFCMASAAAAGNRALGLDRGLPFPLSDIPEADTILIVGSNPAETMPPIMQYFDAQMARGGKLIVADPRRTATANAASLFLQPAPGTDSAVANGLLHIIIRDRLIDEAYVAERTEGFDAVRRVAAAWWPDRTERTTGISAERLTEAAHLLGRSRKTLILTGRGPEQQSHGVDNVLSYINLALALGLPGRPHAGWGTFTGQGNGQGGREHGQKSDQLPGYRSLANDTDRADMAAIWGVPVESLPQPGPPAGKLLAKCGGEIAALIVFGSNLVMSAPNSARVQQKLEALDLLVVADPFLSETAAIADVVLPVAQWAEEEGTMTNLEGRIILRQKMVDAGAGGLDRSADHQRDRGSGGEGQLFHGRRARGVRGVAAGERGWGGGLFRGDVGADRGRGGRILALPIGGSSRHAAPIRRAVRDAERTGEVPPGGASVDGGGAGQALPDDPDDRAGDGAVQHRGANAPGGVAERGGSGGFLRAARRYGAHDRDQAGGPDPAEFAAGQRDLQRAAEPDDPAGYGVHSVSLGR